MTPQRRNVVLATTVSAVVLVVVVAGFTLLGSPSYRRQLRLDAQRVSALQAISDEVARPARESGDATPVVLPPSLEQLVTRQGSWLTPADARDPETGAPYEYRVTDASHYELCASFALPTPSESVARQSGTVAAAFWNHGSGRSCFTLEAGVGVVLTPADAPLTR